jgi:predicted TIM-barrel fold metal-dependent hydrolase
MAELVIDADGHVFEPEELWERYLPSAWHPRRPRIERDERGTTRYVIDGQTISPGRGPGAWVPKGVVEEACLYPGGTDPKARLVDMDVEGIDIAVLYGTVSLGFFARGDSDYTVAICRAYNDWLADYCSAAPGRLKGVPSLPLTDTDATLAELERTVTELGFVALNLPVSILGRHPDDAGNDVLYEAAVDLDIPVSFHVGGAQFLNTRFVDEYHLLHALEFPFDLMYAATRVVCGGVLERHPGLRVSFLEAGTGWLPYLFERLDEHYEKRTDEFDAITKMPSAYLADGRVWVSCEPSETDLAHNADLIGEGQILFASDYPHWDAEFPRSVSLIKDRTELTPTAKEAILGGNARRYFGPRVDSPV